MEHLSSGIDDLDKVLNGLLYGDNVVWVGGDNDVHERLQRGLLSAQGSPPAPLVYVTTEASPAEAASRVGRAVEVLDARRGQAYTDPVALEQALVERASPGARIVIDSLDAFVRRLRAERALAFFSRVCPQLFDLGAIAYWRASSPETRQILEGIRRVTQCVLDVSDGHLRILKAEGRLGVQGRIFRLRVDGDTLSVDRERALGRLAESLRKLRTERHLNQSELARLAGVSPSAISQAEAGHRGLGLDTLVTLAEAMGVGLDHLLSTQQATPYVIARRDRALARHGITPLLHDPKVGLRAHVVALGPAERGEPPVIHKGPELIVVLVGLVQIDLGPEGPVMRAGDAVLATSVAVRGWQNLVAKPARFLWILRDPLSEEA